MAIVRIYNCVLYYILMFISSNLSASVKGDYKVFKESLLLDLYSCDDSEIVLFGNGIRTSYEGADQSLKELQKQVEKKAAD